MVTVYAVTGDPPVLLGGSHSTPIAVPVTVGVFNTGAVGGPSGVTVAVAGSPVPKELVAVTEMVCWTPLVSPLKVHDRVCCGVLAQAGLFDAGEIVALYSEMAE